MNNCNNCERCSQYLNADCIIYDGDSLWWESVRDGSPRELSEVLEGIPDCCVDLTSYLVKGNYTPVSGDENKLLLLQGVDTSTVESPDVTYTITLPTDETFIGKILRIKNISEVTDNAGRIIWEFSTSIKYDWEDNLSSTSFDTLSNSIHDVLWITYVKISDNAYQWFVISPAIPECDHPTETVVEDADMENGWVTFTGSQVSFNQLCDHVQLQGFITIGESGTTVFTLPAGSRPSIDLTFLAVYDGGDPWLAIINVLTSGEVQASVPGMSGDPLLDTDSISLSQVSFYI